MKARLLAFAALALPHAGGCSQPPNMYQPAEVRLVAGTPCFSVPGTTETQRTAPIVAAVAVGEYTAAGPSHIWEWVTPLEPEVTLPPDTCIPFGHPGSAMGPNGIPPLLPGHRYHVSINSQIPSPSQQGDGMVGRMYSADFCLREDASGQPSLVMVPRSRGEAQWEVCGD